MLWVHVYSFFVVDARVYIDFIEKSNERQSWIWYGGYYHHFLGCSRPTPLKKIRPLIRGKKITIYIAFVKAFVCFCGGRLLQEEKAPWIVNSTKQLIPYCGGISCSTIFWVNSCVAAPASVFVDDFWPGRWLQELGKHSFFGEFVGCGGEAFCTTCTFPPENPGFSGGWGDHRAAQPSILRRSSEMI